MINPSYHLTNSMQFSHPITDKLWVKCKNALNNVSTKLQNTILKIKNCLNNLKILEKINEGVSSLNKYYFSVAELQDKELKMLPQEESATTPKGMFDQIGSIYFGHSRGFGTCPLRTFAATQSLLTGQTHIYKHNSRALVLPREFESFYSKKFDSIDKVSFDSYSDGTVFIFSQSSTKINALLHLEGTSSQISHLCIGIKIEGKIYVLEGARTSTTIFESLEKFQNRLYEKALAPINLCLALGTAHPNYTLTPPD